MSAIFNRIPVVRLLMSAGLRPLIPWLTSLQEGTRKLETSLSFDRPCSLFVNLLFPTMGVPVTLTIIFLPLALANLSLPGSSALDTLRGKTKNHGINRNSPIRNSALSSPFPSSMEGRNLIERWDREYNSGYCSVESTGRLYPLGFAATFSSHRGRVRFHRRWFGGKYVKPIFQTARAWCF